MYADRRLAFEKRIKELLADNQKAYPGAHKISGRQWWDLEARILSALEDSFQMGRKAANDAEPAPNPIPPPMTDRNPADE